jgi:hypothetical protein
MLPHLHAELSLCSPWMASIGAPRFPLNVWFIDSRAMVLVLSLVL